MAMQQCQKSMLETLIKTITFDRRQWGRIDVYQKVEDVDYKLFKWLIENGADLNKCYHGATALEYALRHGKFTVARFLVEQGASVRGHENLMQESLFKLIDEYKPNTHEIEMFRDWLKWVIKCGADVNKQYKDAVAVEIALKQNKFKIAQVLVVHGAKIRGQERAVYEFLARLECRANQHLPAFKNEYCETLEWCLTLGYDINLVEDGITLIRHALENNNVDVAKMLEEHGASMTGLKELIQENLHKLISGFNGARKKDFPNFGDSLKWLIDNGADMKRLGTIENKTMTPITKLFSMYADTPYTLTNQLSPLDFVRTIQKLLECDVTLDDLNNTMKHKGLKISMYAYFELSEKARVVFNEILLVNNEVGERFVHYEEVMTAAKVHAWDLIWSVVRVGGARDHSVLQFLLQMAKRCNVVPKYIGNQLEGYFTEESEADKLIMSYVAIYPYYLTPEECYMLSKIAACITQPMLLTHACRLTLRDQFTNSQLSRIVGMYSLPSKIDSYLKFKDVLL